MSPLPLVPGRAGELLLVSRLGVANSRVVPVQRRVDIGVEGSLAQTLHSVQEARHLQTERHNRRLFTPR